MNICNLYKRFIPGYIENKYRLNKLLNKSMTKMWPMGRKQCAAVLTLITAVSTPTVSALPKEVQRRGNI